MNVSLIITTYNRPDALKRSIQSALDQSVLPDEILIADDGSTEETKEMLETILSEVPIRHIWQEDRGFRLAASRNRAIAEAGGDYIINIDGDILMERHFIEEHLSCAERGIYLQGSRVLLSPELTHAILEHALPLPGPFSRGLSNRLNAFRIPWLRRALCTRAHQTLKGVRGCNFSLYREEILKVNGFNEAFTTWGREDSEFVQRLFHAGLKRKNLKFGAIAYHLYHPEGCAPSHNDALLHACIESKSSWCTQGIDRYLKGVAS